ncbi:energy transducer TonB [Leeia sp. TBRC 13508]|uniref:Energy transducer TonB n=1 Tax=Leeia speluncae TaxID=2884804 RepID=A0ABS8D6U3_9NEIS|nr:energy transducer TonB [Leeia speluncae]MCB6183924.1 energy transducer TonB [Leeia speluncae]
MKKIHRPVAFAHVSSLVFHIGMGLLIVACLPDAKSDYHRSSTSNRSLNISFEIETVKPSEALVPEPQTDIQPEPTKAVSPHPKPQTALSHQSKPVVASTVNAMAQTSHTIETSLPNLTTTVKSSTSSNSVTTEKTQSVGVEATRLSAANTPAAQPSTVEQTITKAKPDYAFNPSPNYPSLLREQGVGGVVWIKVWVNEEGKPREIAVKKGSGYRLLDEAALAAVEQWRFFPAKKGNETVASWVEFPVRFSLDT